MMLTHFEALLLFAVVISIAFAFLTKQTARDRLKYAVWAFLAFVGVAVVLGWIMYPFPR
jgi:heme A synthase